MYIKDRAIGTAIIIRLQGDTGVVTVIVYVVGSSDSIDCIGYIN